ncbi:hypothetical protein [Bradyrhizobium sp. I1.7.5]|uniref:hypothetical protein n=1 Tax=Bradyrhizobium sp. I1.7.5 TaxID=3156363 RepID=UPI0033988956
MVLVIDLVVHLLGQFSILKFDRVCAACHHTAIEPDAVLAVVFLFGCDLDGDFVSRIERPGFAVHGHDRIFVFGVWLGFVVGPEKALDGVLKRRVFGSLHGIWNESLEILGAGQPMGLSPA